MATGTHSASPARVLARRGYESEDRVFLKGRVVSPAVALSAIRRFRGIPRLPVHLAYGDQVRTVTTDAEGYYEADFARNPADDDRPDEVHASVRYRDEHADGTHPISGLAATAEYLVVCTVDNTIVRLGNNDFLTAVLLRWLGRAKSRKPLNGIAGLCRAMVNGFAGVAGNPIFYVSEAGRALHEPLAHFLLLNELPDGPVMLRPASRAAAGTGSGSHKQDTIIELLDRFPAHRAVLIGDAARNDPAICSEVARCRPGRVEAIYIHERQRASRITDAYARPQSGQDAKDPPPLVTARDSRRFARHMQSIGLLPATAYSAVIGSVIRDDERGRFES